MDRGHAQGHGFGFPESKGCQTGTAAFSSPHRSHVGWCCSSFMPAVCSERLGLGLTSCFLHFLSILINNMSQFRQASRIIICQAQSLTLPVPTLVFLLLPLCPVFTHPGKFQIFLPGCCHRPETRQTLSSVLFPKVFHQPIVISCTFQCWGRGR